MVVIEGGRVGMGGSGICGRVALFMQNFDGQPSCPHPTRSGMTSKQLKNAKRTCQYFLQPNA